MTRAFHRFVHSSRAAAAAEFALVLPILVVMLFFFWEYGRFVEGTHAVAKAARDGVRFAGRQRWQDFQCPPDVLGGEPNFDAIKVHVVRSLESWGAEVGDVTITRACTNLQTGIYKYKPDVAGPGGGAPVITINVGVPYNSLFGGLTGSLGLHLRATASAAVMGA